MNTIEAQKRRAVQVHSQQVDQFAASYHNLDAAPYRSCFTYSRKRLQAWIDHYLPASGDGLRLLDLGCGTGHQMAQLRRRGFDVTGVDGSEAMLQQARLHNPDAELRLADVEALPFPEASFDLVVCVEVLRYLPRISGCVQEIARVLKPGGVCLATAVPRFNLNGYWMLNRLAVALPLRRFVRLKQFFTTSWHLRHQFVRAGFDAPQIHGVYCGPINWIERLTPGLLPRVLERWERVDAWLADRPVIRECSNMFLVHAVRASRGSGCIPARAR